MFADTTSSRAEWVAPILICLENVLDDVQQLSGGANDGSGGSSTSGPG